MTLCFWWLQLRQKKRNISLAGKKCSKTANPTPKQSPKNVNGIALQELSANFH